MTSESSRHVRGEAPVDGPASHPLMDETISLTREFVHRYWNGGTSWCAARLSDDFAWMGAQDDQSDLSSDSFRRQMEQIAIERPRVVLMCEQYLPVAAQETLCIVAGSYLVFGDPASLLVCAFKYQTRSSSTVAYKTWPSSVVSDTCAMRLMRTMALASWHRRAMSPPPSGSVNKNTI